ncbi:MAG: hypothetical protein NZ899_07170 [Thermoguttaceae bacterium]|nr:hypothetical protein [Thermoguttaceae bacterium]MDW8079666.1 hypothetical protein [Thermoguttaceae bacterium]
MNPKVRQYILAGIFGLMVLYYLGGMLFEQLVQGPLQAARGRTTQLQQNLERRRKELAAARQAAEWLAYWQQQALPPNRELAQSLYQAWLVQLCDEAKLSNRSINVGAPRSPGGQFQVLTFSLRARASLEQLVDFLFGFYRTDLLHQIRTLTVTPLGSAEEFDISMSIEAAMLPEAFGTLTDTEQILREFTARTWRPSRKLAGPSAEAYRQVVVGRNIFRLDPAPDPLDYTFLTSIVESNGQREVSFEVRLTDTRLRLKKGEILELGQFRAIVWEIFDSDVLLQADDGLWLVSLGESISQAAAIPPQF